MFFYGICLFVLMIISVGIIIGDNKGKKERYLEKTITDAFKGSAAILIVCSHIASQVMNSVFIPYQSIPIRFVSGFGAAGVALFFWYSGYFNTLSLNKIKGVNGIFRWVLKRIISIYSIFIISFILVETVAVIFFHIEISAKEVVLNILTLTIPGTTTWYIKIQLIYYIVMAIAKVLADKRLGIICIISIASACTSVAFALIDNTWWNGYTGLVFPFAVFLALYQKEAYKCVNYIRVINMKIVFIVLCVASYCFTVLNRGGYIIQNIAYILFTTSLVTLSSLFPEKYAKIFGPAGVASLALYLVHIGFVKIFSAHGYTTVNLILFSFGVIVATWVVHVSSQHVINHLSKLLFVKSRG